MTLNTGWINEEEFRRLKYLVSSRSVWMEDSNFDGGKILPVLVETTSFTSKRERSNKKYNATIEVRMAYSKRNLEIFNTRSEGELQRMNIGPAPDPCLQVSGYADAHSGNSGLVPLYNTIPIPITATDVTSYHHIDLRIKFNPDESSMQAGEYYCVMLTWDSVMPTEVTNSTELGVISVGNGPSGIDVYWDGASGILSTGWNTCYNSLGLTDVRITFPNFVHKQNWSGVITLYIKKVIPECPCGGY